MTYPDSAPDPVEDLVAECLRRRSDDGTLPIDELCQQHPQLADELRARVRALQEMGMVSNAPAAPPAATPDLQQVGPYRILDRLGEGGMGTVYLAEQKTPVRRRVALKVIKLGMDSKQVLARFEAERQALAMMEHDHIAKVFDAGTTDRGQPFFVMEYVKGVPFTEYCDTHRLSTRERLRLFQQVCDAVQHAHHKGVIHRDLKPSNILVTEHEGKANAKVIDFGLARATDHRLVEATIFTEYGQLLGTPEYMSPEQAEMTSAEVDTRTDVYSLGVLLYELLVGQLPFSGKELRQAGLFELRRKIREEEPPRPSTRLSSLGEGSTATAQHRHTTAQMLLRELRGDLDWIVMRAMEKDRQRRYQTPRELEQEIGRFLANEPVLAGPPGVMYRLRKFVGRNRRMAVAAALAVASLSTAIVSLAWGYVHATHRLQLLTEARETWAWSTFAAGETSQSPPLPDRLRYRLVTPHQGYQATPIELYHTGDKSRIQLLLTEQHQSPPDGRLLLEIPFATARVRREGSTQTVSSATPRAGRMFLTLQIIAVPERTERLLLLRTFDPDSDLGTYEDHQAWIPDVAFTGYRLNHDPEECDAEEPIEVGWEEHLRGGRKLWLRLRD